MALTESTRAIGTILEVSSDGTTYAKVLCNTEAIEIDFGTTDTTSTTCLETGLEKHILGAEKFGDQTLTYTWTQKATSAGDDVIRIAKEATTNIGSTIWVKLTMDNATGAETTGTEYVVQMLVVGHKHMGKSGEKWLSEASFKQVTVPVETAAV